MAAVSSEGSAVSGVVRGSAATWRKQVMVGDLPPDFLRIMITPQQVSRESDARFGTATGAPCWLDGLRCIIDINAHAVVYERL